ncbi:MULTISPECIES: aminotransferase class V-fold PLP-dependent enzyme [Trichocoleus]|uniref:Aminotransferase class V-fold PLP-dependent enzyme n=1 Tax=Trichocoleus desertorum GB2-A4 TaxID=2933944 RepID=A0ABV0J9H7_9CYAN|nr:aminotransferase class V-fold PLP-dependent enzyme [Trichocoleus sp. FACHB-46]MBD1862769.1 aminotransferase class V-fold PLP-dependent enzyme [Trichocoleus sp. FACHB-46]
MTSTLPVHHLLERHRHQFPALANKAYFNYGGQGPMPQAALAAMQQAHLHMQQAGPFSNSSNVWINQESQQTRQTIAAELGVTAETITLTDSVSTGCNIALWGINWQPGDRILMTNCEHQSIIAVVQEIQRRFGVAVDVCSLMATLNAGDPVAAIAQHLTANTRLVVLSHILWNTGQLLPLGEIVAACHAYPTQQHPVRVLVDAAQSVGVLPLDLAALAVDFYAFTGHKWWCGPAGVGGLYIRPDALETLQPTFIGWRGITTDANGQPVGWERGGKRFEVATSDYALYPALRVAIATQSEWGSVEARYQRIQTLSAYLWQQLKELSSVHCLRTAPPEAGLVSFQLVDQASGRSHRQLAQFLESQGLMVRTILNPDCVRACVHYLTLESEIDRLVVGVQQFCQTVG